MSTQRAETGLMDAGWTTDGRASVFSGHESFALRYGWLPKLYDAISTDPALFADDDHAMLTLGLGKNMVRSLRFWGDAFGVIRSTGKATQVTEFGNRLLDPTDGMDPFLEDPSSLWRLHWNLTAHAGLGAWSVAFLDIVDAEVTRERLVDIVRARAASGRGPITVGTASAHIDMMIKTYDEGHSENSAVIEDTLGCPLQELGLIATATPGGTQTIRFRRGAKPGLDVPAIAFALADFWAGTARSSKALSVRSLMLARRSPGAIFRLDEASLYGLLEAICAESLHLVLREDGVGGLDLVSTRGHGPTQLERLAW